MLPETCSENTPSGNGPLRPESIPAELRNIPRWLLWKLENRNAKPTKTPYQTSGALAKVNDPTTWTDFDSALTAYQRGGFSGVGIALTEEDDLVGVDLDKVLNPDTGELDPEAARIVADLPTYCEVSPSGRGLRLFGFGSLPQGGRRKGRVEMYESGRYLTVTGHQFNGHGSLAEITPQLAQVHARIFGAGKAGAGKKTVDSKPAADPQNLDDAALLDKARNARNGADFDRLWSGDTSGHGGDASAADLALCNALAFWTGNDAAKMDRLFRQSGLMRPKWDKPHFADGRTYGQVTIEKAIEGNRETYTGKPAAQARPAQGEGAEANEELQDENLFSDYGNVVKLRNRLADRLAYTPGLDWLIYNSVTGIWEPEPCSERVKRLALETLREAWSSVLYAAQRDEADLKKELKALDGDDPRAAMVQKKVKLATVHRDKVFQWVRQCETAYRIRSTLEIAEGYFWTAPAIWDANPHILVCANGVLDLATGTLLPHSPGHHATKTTGTAFKPGAQHPAWEAVTALLKAEGDRYTFIHQYCGSGLHGANPNERLVIAQGDGGTGKGTLLTAIHQALGAYAETIEVGSLLATDWRRQNKSAPREDLLKLRGARFVSPGIEPPKDSKLDDGSIKALTGNDAISARAPHAKNSITFTPVFKLIVQTNFPLRTEFDDPGMKRRVIVVPFNQKPDRPDPAVKDALIHDPEARAACLAWLYEGYRAWRNAGYALPESALATSATAEYWDDMNPFAQFARDVGLKFGKLERCPKPKLTGALKAWREETGRFDASLKGFPGWLKSKGCFDQQITGGSRFWYGVGFAEASSQQSQESPPDSANTAVDFQYSKSTDKFTNTASDSGYDCYGGSDDPTAPPPRPADDGLKSQHRPVDSTVPRCATCRHLVGHRCHLRAEVIEPPDVGSCRKWEAQPDEPNANAMIPADAGGNKERF